jgi:hypothetical protein
MVLSAVTTSLCESRWRERKDRGRRRSDHEFTNHGLPPQPFGSEMRLIGATAGA